MDQREWGLLRETVVRRTQASGASREDAEDATHDALLAAIGRPQHPQSQVAWLSTVAKRRRVDLIRQRVREERGPTAVMSGETSDPTAAGPEDVVVDREHASWLTASLTQLPPTTREVVDAVGSGMAPAEVASSMNLSTRSVESHLTRARRHLRRMGALGLPIAALLGWTLRTRPGSRVALVAAVPVVAVAVVLLPSARTMDPRPDAAPPPPPAGSPAPVVVTPEPRGGPDSALPPLSSDGSPSTPALPAAGAPDPAAQDASAEPDAGGPGAPEGTRPRAAGPPQGRALPPQCPLQLPVLGDAGCVLIELVDGVAGGVIEGVLPGRDPALPLPTG